MGGYNGEIKDFYQLSVAHTNWLMGIFCFVLNMIFLWSVSETPFLALLQQILTGQQNHVKISLGQM